MLPVSVLCGCSAVDSRRIKYTETVVETNLVSVLFVLGLSVGVLGFFCLVFLVFFFLVWFQGTSSQKELQWRRLYMSDVVVSRSLSAPPCPVPPLRLLSLNPVTAGCRGRAKYLFYILYFF